MSACSDSELIALLDQLSQPAFLVRGQTLLACNAEAQAASGAFRRLLAANALGTPEGSQLGDWSLSPQPLGDCTLVLASPTQPLSDTLTAAGRAIRQPVAVLSAVTSALADSLADTDDPVRQRQTAELRHSLHRLLRLSDNMEIAGAASVPLFRKRLDLRELLEARLPMLEDSCRATGFRLISEFSAEPILLEADFGLLLQALLNLISNAILFSVPETEIRLSVRKSGGSVLLSVRSQPEQEPGADTFLPQPDSLDSRHGAGLGLTVARRIALLHGGSLVLQPAPDAVTAVLSLPAAAGMFFTSPVLNYGRGSGFDPVLVGLSDVLPASVFDPR